MPSLFDEHRPTEDEEDYESDEDEDEETGSNVLVPANNLNADYVNGNDNFDPTTAQHLAATTSFTVDTIAAGQEAASQKASKAKAAKKRLSKRVLHNDDDDYDDDDDDEDYDSDAARKGFHRKPKLPEFVFARRNVAQLVDLLNSDYLDIAPAYQRDVVWPRKRMSKLIDSLMENFYVPPVLFNVTNIKEEDGQVRYRRTCVDGKQRLSSIRDFMRGMIPCHDRKGNPWFFCIEQDADGNPTKRWKKNLLPESIKLEFSRKDILCCEYKDLTERQEREIFQRVQLGIPLTAAEALRATQGEWQQFAQLFEQDFSRVINLVTNKRASGFRRVLTCFSQIYECQDPSTLNGVPKLKYSISELDRFCKDGASLNSKTKSHLRFVFGLFDELVVSYPEIFTDNGYVRVKTFAPIELIVVCVLISVHGDKRPKGMLRGDILALRDQLRSKHVDLMMSSAQWQTAWNYIDDLERYRGTVDGSTIPIRKQRRKQNAATDVAISSAQLDPRGTPKMPRGSAADTSKDSGASGPEAPAARIADRLRLASIATQDEGTTATMRSNAIKETKYNLLSERERREGSGKISTSASPSEGSFQEPFVRSATPRGPATQKKRATLDLGGGYSGSEALAAKKARLMEKGK